MRAEAQIVGSGGYVFIPLGSSFPSHPVLVVSCKVDTVYFYFIDEETTQNG